MNPLDFANKLHPTFLVAKKAASDLAGKLRDFLANPDKQVFQNYVDAFLVPLMEQADEHDVPLPEMIVRTRFGSHAELRFYRSEANRQRAIEQLPKAGDVWKGGGETRLVTDVRAQHNRVTYVPSVDGKSQEPLTVTGQQWSAWLARAELMTNVHEEAPEVTGDSGKKDQQ